MAGMFDDFLSWLAGGTQMGNFLGIASPTASTQAPLAVAPGTAPTASGPILGGSPPAGGGGLLGGLLGGQQPVNPASYFMPRQGLLGDSPLGNMVRGAFSGLGSGAGYGGLTGMGQAFTGGSQAVQDRQKQEMAATLAGQQYQSGQQSLISGAIANEYALQKVNNARRFRGMPEVTMAELVANPDLVSNPTGGQPPAPGSAAATGQAAPTTQPTAPIVPTMTQTDSHLAQAQAPSGTVAGPPPQTAVATQFPNQHGIIVPMTAPPTATLPSTTNVQPQSAATASQPAIPMKNGTTSAPPATTAPPPTQQTGGGFPQTEAEINASSLPDWAKNELLQAGYTGDSAEIMKAQADVGKYIGEPQQKAAVEQATGQQKFVGSQASYDRIKDQGNKFTGSDAYKLYHDTVTPYQAGKAAYEARQGAKGALPSDVDLLNAVVHVMNPQGPGGSLRQGTLDAVGEAKGIEAMIQKGIQEIKGGTGLTGDVADVLMQILDRHMKIVQKQFDAATNTTRKAVKYYDSNAPDFLWNPDAPQDPVRITGDTDPAFLALERGDPYIGPDGIPRTKP